MKKVIFFIKTIFIAIGIAFSGAIAIGVAQSIFSHKSMDVDSALTLLLGVLSFPVALHLLKLLNKELK